MTPFGGTIEDVEVGVAALLDELADVWEAVAQLLYAIAEVEDLSPLATIHVEGARALLVGRVTSAAAATVDVLEHSRHVADDAEDGD